MSGQVRRPQTAERRGSLDGQEKRSAWNADHSPAHTIAPHASTSGQHEAWRHRQDRTWAEATSAQAKTGAQRLYWLTQTAPLAARQHNNVVLTIVANQLSRQCAQQCGGVGSEMRSALQVMPSLQWRQMH